MIKTIQKPKRLLSLLLAAVMILTLMPVMTVPAQAATGTSYLRYSTNRSGGTPTSTTLVSFSGANLSQGSGFLWIHNSSTTEAATYDIQSNQYAMWGTLVLTSAGGPFKVKSSSGDATIQLCPRSSIYIGSNVEVYSDNSKTSLWCNDSSQVAITIYCAGSVPGGISANNVYHVDLYRLGTTPHINNGNEKITNYDYYSMSVSKEKNVATATHTSTSTALYEASTYEGKSYYPSGSTVTVSATANTGYRISSGTGTYTMNSNQAVTVRAAANDYTVNFNLNYTGAGTNPSSKSVTYDSTYGTLPTPLRTGYTFAGWYTSSTGGTQVTASTKYSPTSPGTHTLHARWTENSYTIKFNMNLPNASQTPTGIADVTQKYTASVTLPSPTHAGYIFNGWAKTSGGDVSYAGDSEQSKLAGSGTITLYANWTPITYDVIYHSMDGLEQTRQQTLTYDKNEDLDANPWSYTGYDFLGWSLTKGGSSSDVADGASMPNLSSTLGDVIKLYAIWTPKGSGITFDNDGVVDNVMRTIDYDDLLTNLSGNELPRREGFTFGGYFTTKTYGTMIFDADGTAKTGVAGYVTNDGRWNRTTATTLYAKWDRKSYTITFEHQNNTEATQRATTLDSAFLVTPPILLDSAFAGYYTTADDETVTGVQVFDADGALVANVNGYTNDKGQWIRAEDTTLYARWTAVSDCTVTLNPQGGTGGDSSVAQTKGAQAATIDNLPTKSGYTFAGYYTLTNGQGQQVFDKDGAPVAGVTGYTDADGKWIPTGEFTLHARWVSMDYELALVMGGAVTNPAAATKTVQATYGLPLGQTNSTSGITIPTRENLKLMGFFDQPDGAGNLFIDASGKFTSQVWSRTDDLRLYAHWEATPYNTSIANGSFEFPAITGWNHQFDYTTKPGVEWMTTSSDKKIEYGRPSIDVKSSQSAYKASYAPDGEQFAELNAEQVAALYQLVTTNPGQELKWGLYHKGREGNDTMQVWIGAPADVLEAISQYKSKTITTTTTNRKGKVTTTTSTVTNSVDNVDESLLAKIAQNNDQNGTVNITTGNTTWKQYTGTYEVPGGQTETMFAFVSKSASGGVSMGNLLDNIYFSSEVPKPTGSVRINATTNGEANVLVDGFVMGKIDNESTGNLVLSPTAGSKLTFESLMDSDYYSYGIFVTSDGVTTYHGTDTDTIELEIAEKSYDISVIFVKRGWLTLNPAGGSVDPVERSFDAANATFTLPSPTRTGYQFEGWMIPNTQLAPLAAGDTVKYELEAESSTPFLKAYAAGNDTDPVHFVNANTQGMVLVAKWSVPTLYNLTISYDLNDAAPADADDPTIKSAPATLYGMLDDGNLRGVVDCSTPDGIALPAPVRTGYEFTGWQVSGETDTYQAGDPVAYSSSWTAPQTLSLVAQWAETGTIIGANADTAGGSGTDISANYTHDFGTKQTGYTIGDGQNNTFAPLVITVSNLGEIDTDTITAATTDSNFVVDYTSGSIAVDGSLTVTVKPTPGKQVGSYADVLTITAGNANTISITLRYAVTSTGLAFDTDGGYFTETVPSSYTPSTSAQDLPTPKKTGYVFQGWDNTATADTVENHKSIPANTTGDLSYKAIWAACGHDSPTASVTQDCTTGGTCADCGVVLSALGHKFTNYQALDPATCISKGTEKAICDRDSCSETHTVEGDAPDMTAHNAALNATTGDFTQTTAPTCVLPGISTATCPDCGRTATKAINATGHGWDSNKTVSDVHESIDGVDGWELVSASTECEGSDFYKRTCTHSSCGYFEVYAASKDGHEYQPTHRAATCTQAEYTEQICSKCGAIEREEGDTPALQHNFTDADCRIIASTAADCTTAGSKTVQCLRCTETQVQAIPATGHDFSDTYTHTKGRTCKVGKTADCSPTHWLVCGNNDCTEKSGETTHTIAGYTDGYIANLQNALFCGGRDASSTDAETANGCGHLMRAALEPSSNAANAMSVVFTTEPFSVNSTGGAAGSPGFIKGANTGEATYRIIAGPDTTGEGTIVATGIGAGNLTVTKAGTFKIGVTTAKTATHDAAPEVPFIVTVTKAEQTAPVAEENKPESGDGKGDGEIKGLEPNTKYEISTDGGNTKKTVTSDGSGIIKGLDDGSYVIRLPETPNYNPGGWSDPVKIRRTFTITYHELGGAIGDTTYPTTIVEGGSADLPIDVTRANYSFLGWYENTDSITQISAVSNADGNKVFFAKWALAQAGITLKINNATTDEDETGTLAVEPEDYAYSSTMLVTATPKNGYELTGLSYAHSSGGEKNILSSKTFVMPGEDVVVAATFSPTAARTAALDALGEAYETYVNENGKGELVDWIRDEILERLKDYGVTEEQVRIDLIQIGGKDFTPAVYTPGSEADGAFDFRIVITGNETLGEIDMDVKNMGKILQKSEISHVNALFTPPETGKLPGDITFDIQDASGTSLLTGSYVTIAEFEWKKLADNNVWHPNGYFDAFTEYEVTLKLEVMGETHFFSPTADITAKANSLTDQTGQTPPYPKVDIVVDEGGKAATMTIIYKTGPRMATELTVSGGKLVYVTGDTLDIGDASVSAAFNDHTKTKDGETLGGYEPAIAVEYKIGDTVVDSDVALKKSDNGKTVYVTIGGKTVAVGMLSVNDPPVLEITNVHNTVFVFADNKVSGQLDYSITKKDLNFTYSFTMTEKDDTSKVILSETVSTTQTATVAKSAVAVENLVPGTEYTLSLTATTVSDTDVLNGRSYTVTKDYTFARAAGTVSGLADDTDYTDDTIFSDRDGDGSIGQSDYYTYMTGDKLDLSEIVIVVTFDNGNKEILPLSELLEDGAIIKIDGKAFDPDSDVLRRDDGNGNDLHHDKTVSVVYGGKSVDIGTLVVFNPPIPYLTALYGITVTSGEVKGTADIAVTQGTNEFTYKLEIGNTVLDASSNALDTHLDTKAVAVANMTPGQQYTITLTATDATTGRSYTAERTFTASSYIPSDGFDLKGIVLDSNGDRIMKISLERGPELLQTAKITTSSGQSGGKFTYSFTFEHIQPGIYNLVVDNGEWLVTYGVIMDEDGNVSPPIVIDMGTGNTQSVIEHTSSAPVVVADGLPDLFDNSVLYTTDDQTHVNTDKGTIEFKLLVQDEEKVPQTDKDALDGFANKNSKTLATIFDLSLQKNYYDAHGNQIKTEDIKYLEGETLTLTIDIPAQLQGKNGLAVARVHYGAADDESTRTLELLPLTGEAGPGDEHYDIYAGQIMLTLELGKFSSYAFLHDPDPTNPSKPDSNLIIDSTTGGNVTPQPENPKKGDTVVLTPKAEDGFELDSIVIRDEKGNDIPYTVNDDGSISFTMPDGKVTVTPRFKRGFDVSGILNTADHFAYLQGYPGGNFGPRDHMTRAEMAQMFYNLLLDKDVTTTKTFPDVPAGAWYAEAVHVMAELGIVAGYSNGNYGPNDPITRAQFATVMVRFTQVSGTSGTAARFTDVPKTHWAYSYIGFAYELGLISGVNTGMTLFAPDQNITRAEAATMVNRILGRAADKNAADTWDIRRFPDVDKREWYWYEVVEATNGHDWKQEDGEELWTALN